MLAPASEKSDGGTETPLGREGMCEEQSDSELPHGADADVPACAESSKAVTGCRNTQFWASGPGKERESSQGKEVVPLGLKLPQEGGVCAVVLLLPWDAGWEEFVWNAVNCIFSWGTRALLSSERAIMYLSGSLLCHSGIPKTQIGNRILASNSHVTCC